jgi:acetyl esterase/lipase
LNADVIQFAPGTAKADIREQDFGVPEDAAMFWNYRTDVGETRDLTYPGAEEHDVPFDDCHALAKGLKQVSVQCQFYVEPGVTHGFIERGRPVPSADISIKRAADFLCGIR